jgi:hypothetical protein
MVSPSVTVQLPDAIYVALLDRAAHSQRTVQEELVHVVSLALPAESELPERMQREIKGLVGLSDPDLWNAARTQVADVDSQRLEELHYKASTEGLTEAEGEEQTRLLQECDRVMLVRAHAAVLLKERGHDISILLQP